MITVSPWPHRASSEELMADIPEEKASEETRTSLGLASLTSLPSSAFILASSSRTVGLPSRV